MARTERAVVLCKTKTRCRYAFPPHKPCTTVTMTARAAILLHPSQRNQSADKMKKGGKLQRTLALVSLPLVHVFPRFLMRSSEGQDYFACSTSSNSRRMYCGRGAASRVPVWHSSPLFTHAKSLELLPHNTAAAACQISIYFTTWSGYTVRSFLSILARACWFEPGGDV